MDNFDEIDEVNLLSCMKEAYIERVKQTGVPNDSNIFPWISKKIKITIIPLVNLIPNNPITSASLFFGNSSSEDSLKIINLPKKITDEYEYKLINYLKESTVINYFKTKNMINENNLIFQPQMLFGEVNNIKVFRDTLMRKAIDLVDEQYKTSTKKLKSTTSIPKVSYDYFADIYDFKKMLSVINDNQFTDELNQCIEAYNKSMWYVCAAGLGGIIEHLMFLTLDNYGLATNRLLSKNPTANNYIKAFERPEVGLESRQETFINILFSARNAVSHYNSGLTNKSLCDLLLTGIKDLYQDYYVKSLTWKEQNEN